MSRANSLYSKKTYDKNWPMSARYLDYYCFKTDLECGQGRRRWRRQWKNLLHSFLIPLWGEKYR